MYINGWQYVKCLYLILLIDKINLSCSQNETIFASKIYNLSSQTLSNL